MSLMDTFMPSEWRYFKFHSNILEGLQEVQSNLNDTILCQTGQVTIKNSYFSWLILKRPCLDKALINLHLISCILMILLSYFINTNIHLTYWSFSTRCKEIFILALKINIKTIISFLMSVIDQKRGNIIQHDNYLKSRWILTNFIWTALSKII